MSTISYSPARSAVARYSSSFRTQTRQLAAVFRSQKQLQTIVESKPLLIFTSVAAILIVRKVVPMMLGETKITIESKPPPVMQGAPTMGFIKKFFMAIGFSIISFAIVFLAMFVVLIVLLIELLNQ